MTQIRMAEADMPRLAELVAKARAGAKGGGPLGAEDHGGRLGAEDNGESWQGTESWDGGGKGRQPVTVVLVDGPSGAGKTTLAGELASITGAQVIGTDDLLNGWDDQFTYWDRLLDNILRPIERGEDARFKRYDWHEGRFGDEIIHVRAHGVLIIEGVGVAREEGRRRASLTIFVDAPREIRQARSLERDGEAMQEQLKVWRRREELHFAADGTAWAADVVIGSST